MRVADTTRGSCSQPIREIRVIRGFEYLLLSHSCRFVVERNRLDGVLRRTDKRTVGKNIDPEEGAANSSAVGLQNPPYTPWKRTTVQWILRNRKTMRIYLIGMLCGLVLGTTFTYMFAIPANSDYWRMEIYKRGGAAWTMNMKTGHTGWKWLIDPIPDAPRQKPVTVPASHTKSRTEQL